MTGFSCLLHAQDVFGMAQAASRGAYESAKLVADTVTGGMFSAGGASGGWVGGRALGGGGRTAPRPPCHCRCSAARNVRKLAVAAVPFSWPAFAHRLSGQPCKWVPRLPPPIACNQA